MLLKRFSIALALTMILAACGGSSAEETAAGEPATEQMDDTMSEETMDDTMSEETMDDTMSEETKDDGMSEETMDDGMSEETMEDNVSEGHMPTSFTVTIQNTSDSAVLPTPLAPGVFVIHGAPEVIFTAGEVDRGAGLEELAEDGDPSGLVTSLATVSTVSATGSFAVPDGAAEAGPALPGSSYSFSFEATPGEYLSFATMFVQSNDWFFAPAASGIGLFDGDAPLEGDITELVLLWDAGTEVDETPGEGPNQAPRQAGPDTGDAQDAPIAGVVGFAGSIAVSLTVSG